MVSSGKSLKVNLLSSLAAVENTLGLLLLSFAIGWLTSDDEDDEEEEEEEEKEEEDIFRPCSLDRNLRSIIIACIACENKSTSKRIRVIIIRRYIH